jgi:hypothetical protein
MAMTINRNNEISEQEFKALKEMFNEKTNSKAVYACVKYILENKDLDYLTEIEKLKAQLSEITEKHKRVLDSIKHKRAIDNEFNQMLLSA